MMSRIAGSSLRSVDHSASIRRCAEIRAKLVVRLLRVAAESRWTTVVVPQAPEVPFEQDWWT